MRNLYTRGLPLVFADEIDGWINPDESFEIFPANTPITNLDSVIKISEHRYSTQLVNSVLIDVDALQVFATMASTLKKK